MNTVIVLIGKQPDHLYLLVENAPSVEAAVEATRKTVSEGALVEGSIVTPIEFDELAKEGKV